MREFKPIRSERKRRMLHDPWGSGSTPSQQEDVTHFLSPSGGLESEIIERVVAYDCGCVNKAPGGFCVDCVYEGHKRLQCIDCYINCRCGRPVCKSHSGSVCFPDGFELKLCGQCFEVAAKRSFIEEIRSIFFPCC